MLSDIVLNNVRNSVADHQILSDNVLNIVRNSVADHQILSDNVLNIVRSPMLPGTVVFISSSW
jgi:hypothetical protein